MTVDSRLLKVSLLLFMSHSICCEDWLDSGRRARKMSIKIIFYSIKMPILRSTDSRSHCVIQPIHCFSSMWYVRLLETARHSFSIFFYDKRRNIYDLLCDYPRWTIGACSSGVTSGLHVKLSARLTVHTPDRRPFNNHIRIKLRFLAVFMSFPLSSSMKSYH